MWRIWILSESDILRNTSEFRHPWGHLYTLNICILCLVSYIMYNLMKLNGFSQEFLKKTDNFFVKYHTLPRPDLEQYTIVRFRLVFAVYWFESDNIGHGPPGSTPSHKEMLSLCFFLRSSLFLLGRYLSLLWWFRRLNVGACCRRATRWPRMPRISLSSTRWTSGWPASKCQGSTLSQPFSSEREEKINVNFEHFSSGSPR